MRKLVMIVLTLCISVSLFAFDGTSRYNNKRNNIGFGVSYGRYSLLDKRNDSTKEINGTALSFLTETSLENNRDTTFFWDFSILLPSASTIGENGGEHEKLTQYNKFNSIAYTDLRIIAFDTEFGLNRYTNIKDSFEAYYGGGLRFSLYDVKGTKTTSTIENNAGLYSFGALANIGLQYHISDSFAVNLGASLGYDFLIFNYIDGSSTDLSSHHGIKSFAKLIFTYRLDGLAF